MFVRRKDAERSAARSLRRQGLSLRAIAMELKVALSSVSVWVRDIPRGPAQSLHPEPSDDTEEATPRPVQPSAHDTAVRTCSRCEEVLPVTAFNRHGDGHQWWCRACFREYFRERGALHLDQVRASKRKRRARAKAFVNEYLETHPCVNCGESDRVVLEFDHVGVKTGHISRLADSGYSIAALEAEISACEVVCANCHRRRTAERVGSWRLDPAVLDSRPLRPEQVRNMKLVLGTLRAGHCADCGERDLLVLEFDHVGPKRAAISVLARRGNREELLKREIARCVVRCANCHRRRTVHERRKAARAKLKPPP
jgi:hypothetical protein